VPHKIRFRKKKNPGFSKTQKYYIYDHAYENFDFPTLETPTELATGNTGVKAHVCRVKAVLSGILGGRGGEGLLRFLHFSGYHNVMPNVYLEPSWTDLTQLVN